MPLIQLDIPEKVNEELQIYTIRNKLGDKRKAIIKILKEKLIKK